MSKYLEVAELIQKKIKDLNSFSLSNEPLSYTSLDKKQCRFIKSKRKELEDLNKSLIQLHIEDLIKQAGDKQELQNNAE